MKIHYSIIKIRQSSPYLPRIAKRRSKQKRFSIFTLHILCNTDDEKKNNNRNIKVKKRHDSLHLTKEKKANLHLLHIESHPPKQALNQYKEVRSQEHEGQGEEQRGSSQQQAQEVRSI